MILIFLLACTKQIKPDTAAAVVAAGCTGCDSGEPTLELVADVDLPGAAVRFDYQDIDAANGHLVIAHMNDDAVVIVNLSDGSTAAELTGVNTARGVVVAPEVGRIFVTASPNQVVAIDSDTLTEVDRYTTGSSPDGVGWDPDHEVIGVSDQGDGAISLLAEAGAGERTQVELGSATGNVVYDATRGWFWITVEHSTDPDQLVAVDPTTGAIETSFDLDGCRSAHGLRLHPDAASAFVACEGNDVLVRVDLSTGEQDKGDTGNGPDVMALDPDLGVLYVAAESGTLTTFDLNAEGVSRLSKEEPGDDAHTVAVDPSTHRVYFPLVAGDEGTPVLRIMQPVGSEG